MEIITKFKLKLINILFRDEAGQNFYNEIAKQINTLCQVLI